MKVLSNHSAKCSTDPKNHFNIKIRQKTIRICVFNESDTEREIVLGAEGEAAGKEIWRKEKKFRFMIRRAVKVS